MRHQVATREKRFRRHNLARSRKVIATLGGLCAVVSIAIAWGRQARRAEKEKEAYAVLAEFSDTVLFEYLYDDDVFEFTSNARKMLPLNALRKEHYLERGEPIVATGETNFPAMRDMLEHPVANGESREMVFKERGVSGDMRWFCYKCRYLFDGDRPYAAVGKIVDITDQREREEALRHRSQTDGLTGICNKETMEIETRAAMQECSEGLLFVMDVNRFKVINDERGHMMGDHVLASIGSVMRDVFRRDDLVGRIGGDEFMAFISGASTTDVAEEKKLLLDQHARLIAREVGFEVTFSVGVARYPEDGSTYDQLFEIADRAMYGDKELRRVG